MAINRTPFSSPACPIICLRCSQPAPPITQLRPLSDMERTGTGLHVFQRFHPAPCWTRSRSVVKFDLDCYSRTESCLMYRSRTIFNEVDEQSCGFSAAPNRLQLRSRLVVVVLVVCNEASSIYVSQLYALTLV